MKVHLGSGNRYLQGWVNVDLYAGKVDVREDLLVIDFPPETVDSILFVHTIEHFARTDGIKILARCFQWLQQNGTIEIETPEQNKCYSLIRDGDLLQGAKGLFGGRSDNKKDWHRWLKRWAKLDVFHNKTVIPEEWDVPGENHIHVWSQYELAGEMLRIGYNIKFESPQHHGRRYKRDMRIVGRKP